MNLLIKFLELLDSQMNTPSSYGWFHFLFIGIVVVTTTLLCIFYKDCDNKTFKLISLISWIIIVSLEFYKQFVFSYDIDGNNITWDYEWYSFPFQFCSTPLYILPFIIFLKNEKFKDVFIGYMATFSLFAGTVVFIYPNDVFIGTIGINIQTMIHHGLQIILGIFYIVHNRNKFNLMYYVKSIPVFVSVIMIAMVANIAVYHIFKNLGIDDTFNMFYISPYFDCTLPLLSIIYDNTVYPIFLCIYLFGFILVAFIVYEIAHLILFITNNLIMNYKLRHKTA